MTENTHAAPEEAARKANGQQRPKAKPRIINNPNDVASLVLMQIDAINAKKDDLTIAIKGMTDLTKQLVQAYADHTKTIQKLAERVKQLEEKVEKG